jgi:uncharacterized membrane protein YphA (DoxX/SURF4 family)
MRNKLKNISQLITRLALGIGFLYPVADRLGFLGAPGSGVNWGDWKHFTDYSHTVMAFLPRALSDLNALIATILEIIFGMSLLLGFKIRVTAIGSAILTLLFALSMIISNGILAPIKYPVFVFVGASLLLAQMDYFKWSIDSLLIGTDKTGKH